MNIDQKVLGRLDELITLGDRVLSTAYSRSSPGFVYLGDHGVDSQLSYQWGVSCLNILRRVFGQGSDHYIRFEKLS
ncbi:MAG TPA: DUF4145 domain-containing protein, partial [Armatimonadota bacterium]|nr:DUF4145 domain-containing protein [Armatimonadota bacterium]